MRTALLPVLAVAAAAAFPAAAGADSIVFIKSHDVWTAKPDGSGAKRVTRDGTAANPYQSPSQADDGTIVTMRPKPAHAPLIRLSPQGKRLKPIPTGATQFGVFDPQVSPDGRHVAFTIARGGVVNWYYESQTDVRTVRTDGTGTGELTGANATAPAWLDSGQLLVGVGPVAKVDPVGGGPREWWSDYAHVGGAFPDGEDLTDGEAAPGRVVFVRGYGEGNTMHVYRTDGTTTSVPEPTCTFSDPAPGPNGARFADPTLSADGKRMLWQEGDGIWAVDQPSPEDCAIEPRLLIPGGSAPDWSRAR